MAHGNFPFHFGGDFYPSRSGFEDPDQCPMQPYFHPYSLTPSQVQYGPNSVDFGGSSLSASISGSASAVLVKPARRMPPLIWMKRVERFTINGQENKKISSFTSGQSTITSWRVPKVENIGLR